MTKKDDFREALGVYDYALLRNKDDHADALKWLVIAMLEAMTPEQRAEVRSRL